jgi:ADP-ribose pyrophosphatase YjhB (NUDIX family)
MERKIFTLAFILHDGKILLGLKKKETLGHGKWNGFGGKVKGDESILDAAKRELKEESGVIALTMEKRGVQEFVGEKRPGEILEVHTFLITKWHGEPAETEEMIPKWFPLTDIPYQNMWDDDKISLPIFLENKFFIAKFWLDEDEQVVEYDIEVGNSKDFLDEKYSTQE